MKPISTNIFDKTLLTEYNHLLPTAHHVCCWLCDIPQSPSRWRSSSGSSGSEVKCIGKETAIW